MSTTSSGERQHRPDALRLLTAVGSPIALATALLLYFGWVRSDAQARAFGADASVFELSAQDLVLRSIDVLFFPILLLFLVGLLALRLDPWLRARAGRLAPFLRFSWLLAPSGLVLVAVTAGPPGSPKAETLSIGEIVLPLLVLLAIGGTAYGNLLRRHARGDHRPARGAAVALVVAMLTVTLFWQTERLARASAELLADDLKRHVAAELPAVRVFSAARLHLEGEGVVETVLGDDPADEGDAEGAAGGDSAYRYRYEGLYLLQRSGGKYFLLTDGWHQDRGRLVILADGEAIRLEFGD